MSECWNEDQSSRPSFSELIDRLEVILTRDVPYCDMNMQEESRPYYNGPANADEHSGWESDTKVYKITHNGRET